MERLQSTRENRVAWNLSESGVHPLRLEELADTPEDRRSPTAVPRPTASCSGTFVERGDDVVMMVPNYMQMGGTLLYRLTPASF